MTVQQPHWPLGEQPSFGEVMLSSSRSAANKWGWCEPTVTGVPFTSIATLDTVSPMALPYTYWVSILHFVKPGSFSREQRLVVR